MNAGSLVRRPMATALVVFAVALPAFLLLKSNSEPDSPVARADAVAIARADPQVQKQLAGEGFTDARVSPLDSRQQRVGFFRGARLIAVALVGPDGRVRRVAPGSGTVGSPIANRPLLLIGLALTFSLALATVPLLSVRNLDVLAFAGFTLVPWLTGEGFLDASLLVAYPLLGYLALRFLWVARNGSPHSSSLYWRLTAGWSLPERRRVPRVVALGLAALTAILTLSSNGASDVAYASLAGATDLIHGTVPYGHIPGFIVHGDTYPPLTYVAYIPGAALSPVTDAFSDPQGALVLTALAGLLAALMLYRVAGRDGAADASRRVDDAVEPPDVTGLRAAVAWLAFPPVLLATSSGSNDVLLALCLVGALASIASAGRSTILLGVAAWLKVIPVFALPIWIARMGRRQALRAMAGLAALSAGVLGALLALGGPDSLSSMVEAMRFQFERRSLFSLWTGAGLGPLHAVAQAALVASVIGMTLAVRRRPELRDDRVRLGAMLAALMLLSQLASNYLTWSYLPWVLGPALFVLAPAVGREPATSTATLEPAPVDRPMSVGGFATGKSQLPSSA